MSKFQKVISDETSVAADLEVKVEELRKQLNAEQRERKSEVNNVKMKYDSRVAIMNEEIVSLKSQCSKYRRERESYKVTKTPTVDLFLFFKNIYLSEAVYIQFDYNEHKYSLISSVHANTFLSHLVTDISLTCFLFIDVLPRST